MCYLYGLATVPLGYHEETNFMPSEGIEQRTSGRNRSAPPGAWPARQVASCRSFPETDVTDYGIRGQE